MYNLCPFCGDNNAICEPFGDESAVRCQTCGAEGPIGNFKEAGDLWDNQQSLTRDQAIKRIRDIRKGIEIDHLVDNQRSCVEEGVSVSHSAFGEFFVPKSAQSINIDMEFPSGCFNTEENRLTLAQSLHRKEGAIAELIAVFDIKDEEI